jgi:hypothetical protein
MQQLRAAAYLAAKPPESAPKIPAVAGGPDAKMNAAAMAPMHDGARAYLASGINNACFIRAPSNKSRFHHGTKCAAIL